MALGMTTLKSTKAFNTSGHHGRLMKVNVGILVFSGGLEVTLSIYWLLGRISNVLPPK